MHSGLDYALKKGAQYAEIRSVVAKRTSIETQNKEIKELSSSEVKSFSVRVFYKGGEGIAFSTKENYNDLVDNALSAAKNFGKGVSLETLPSLKKNIKTKVKINPEDIDIEEKKENLLRLDVKEEFKKVNSCRLVYNDSLRDINFENTEGRSLKWDDVVVSFVAQAFAKEGKRLENFYDVERAHKGYEVLDSSQKLVRETMKMAQALLKAKHAKGGNFPAIIDQKLGGVFAHEAVGHGCEADIVLQGGSILKDKLNQKIAVKDLTLVDDGTKEGFYGWVPFDDEGVEGQKTVLIENGYLKGYLHNRQSASKMKVEPTGNGRAETVGYPAIPRMRCTYIENGTANFKELLEELKDGYYLKGTAGGEVNPATGEFLFNASYGYKVENGELKELLKGVSLNGSILDILPTIKLIGNDLSFSHGTCGKNGQGVPVSDGAPHILLSKVKIGGQQ